MTRRLMALCGLVVSAACVATPNGVGGGQSPVGNAAINTAIAGGVAVERRHEGECYTPCTPGNVCNPKTGYCEPIPCQGTCREDQTCDASGLVPHCVPNTQLEIKHGAGVQAPPPGDPLH
jgi:hypothetical protein